MQVLGHLPKMVSREERLHANRHKARELLPVGVGDYGFRRHRFLGNGVLRMSGGYD
jgi:hypothetical protein